MNFIAELQGYKVVTFQVGKRRRRTVVLMQPNAEYSPSHTQRVMYTR